MKPPLLPLNHFTGVPGWHYFICDHAGMEVWFNDFEYTPGCEYDGNDDFIRRGVQAMNLVHDSGGDKLINALVSSENKYSFVPDLEGESYTTGKQFGNAEIHLNVALDRDGFISAVAHESMHAGQFLNGQGGRSVFNEVEAYAFESTISINANELSDDFRFTSGASCANDNFWGGLYEDAISSLSTKYSY